ncbi:hypothetical protein [Streptomyces sp. NPDC018059]|uniref:hypothetical protein n=1 Tax=Streptomyces sp. NPDC018059 TaxID=3365041 RepID=UPI0037B185B8
MSYNARDLTSPWPRGQDRSPDAARTLGLLEREYGPGAHLTQLYFSLWEYATSHRRGRGRRVVVAGLRALGPPVAPVGALTAAATVDGVDVPAEVRLP